MSVILHCHICSKTDLQGFPGRAAAFFIHPQLPAFGRETSPARQGPSGTVLGPPPLHTHMPFLLPLFLCERELLQDEQGCSRSMTSVSHASCHLPLLPALLPGPGPASRRGTERESWRDKAEECPLEQLPLVPWRLGSGFMVAGSSRNVLPSQGSAWWGTSLGLSTLAIGGLALDWLEASSGGQAQGGGRDGCRFAEE